MSSVLSQEEIDALLNDTFDNESSQETPDGESMSDMEIDALGELANISMGTAATTLSSLLGKKVDITAPSLIITSLAELREQYPSPYVVVDVNYSSGLEGSNVLVIHTYDAGVMVDLMMGGDGSNPPMELTDLHLSAVSEAMNQMMGSSCTSLSQILNKMINIDPPTLDTFELHEHKLLGSDIGSVVKISFRVIINGLVDSELMQLLPIPFAKKMVSELMGKNDMSHYQPNNKGVENDFTRKSDSHQTSDKGGGYQNQSLTGSVQPVQTNAQQSQGFPNSHGTGPMTQQQPQVVVAPVDFDHFQPAEEKPRGIPNLDLILDVGLQLSVELGRTNKRVKDILDLSIGSILELDKLAGEPVDVLVNGKLLAKGEVVVIDENFGVRVTEIVSPLERVKSLK